MVLILVGEFVLLIFIPEDPEESPAPNGARNAAERWGPAEHQRDVESHGVTRVRVRHRELTRHRSQISCCFILKRTSSKVSAKK